MIQVSTEVANALSQLSREFDAKIYVNGSAVDCEIMSLKLHKGACGKFTVGSIFIPYVELTVNGTTTLTTNTEFELKIAVKVNGSFGTYYRVGYFTPTSIENGRTQTEIYAQGRLADTNGVLFSTEPTARSLNNILTAIRNKGYTVDLKDLTIPSASIDQLIPLIGLSVRDGLCLLASCSGGYVTEDSNGHIVLGKFTQSTPIFVNGDALSEYPKVQGEYELTGITVVVNESLKFDIGGTANFQIENPYFNSDMVSQFTANTIGYTFSVTEMPIALGDFRFEPWDWLSFDNTSIPCLTLDFDFDGGLQTSIKAEGDLPEVTNTKTAGPISAQLKEAYDKAIGANDLANSVNERVDQIEEDGVTTVITKVQWNYGDTNEPKGTWTDDIPALTSTYPYLWTRIATVSRDPQTGVETITDSTTPQKSTLLNGAYAFISGAEDGTTLIHGGCIRTGTVDADYIDTNFVLVGNAGGNHIELDPNVFGIVGTNTTLTMANGVLTIAYNGTEMFSVMAGAASSSITTTASASVSMGEAKTVSLSGIPNPLNYIRVKFTYTQTSPYIGKTIAYANINRSGIVTTAYGIQFFVSGSSVTIGNGYDGTYNMGNGRYAQEAEVVSVSYTYTSAGELLNVGGSFYVDTFGNVHANNIPSGTILTSSNYSSYKNYTSGLNVTGDTILTYSGQTCTIRPQASNGWLYCDKGFYSGSELRWQSTPSSGGTSQGTLYCKSSSIAGYYVALSSSSKYLKHDIEDVKDINVYGLYDLPVRQFHWNEDMDETDELVCGFIADEVAEHFPQGAIYRDSYRDGKDPADWDDRQILPAMLKLIQDQHHDIEELKSQIQELRGA